MTSPRFAISTQGEYRVKSSKFAMDPVESVTPPHTVSQSTSTATESNTYSPIIAFIYVFNLVVGTGALALPSVLTTGGWYLGAIFLFIVACQSYIGVTFVIESMAAANAMLTMEQTEDEVMDSRIETASLLRHGEVVVSRFEIVKRMELGQMAEMFFGRWGQLFFYVALISYLFGDAAIYCTFIPRSLVGFVYGESAPAWAFDAFLCLFVLLIVPFCFFDFQKTKLLQMATMGIRNAALFTIIFLAIRSSIVEGPQAGGVPSFRPQALPNLFGGAVYAFMCHHSLPGIITPMRQKSYIPRVISSAFVGIFLIYLLLFISCGIAFGLKAEDPVTFNFPPEKYGWIGDGLFLFPVFTLSSSFPMLAITLRNNLDTLLTLIFSRAPVAPTAKARDHSPGDISAADSTPLEKKAARRRFLVTLLAVGPPIATCLIAEHNGLDVNSLVGLTGAYAGAAVMLIIPACLVHSSRRVIAREYQSGESGRLWVNQLGNKSHPLNIHASPFKGQAWVVLLIAVAALTIAFITWEKIAG